MANLMHRDDFPLPFELLNRIEEGIGQKVIFPGDRQLGVEATTKIEKYYQFIRDTFAAKKCRYCEKYIAEFNPDDIVDFELNSFLDSSQSYLSFKISYSFMAESYALICNECHKERFE